MSWEKYDKPHIGQLIKDRLQHEPEIVVRLSHYFPANLGAVTERQGEIFHQDISEIERRYQRRWNVGMMADYCWMLQREVPEGVHKRKSTTRNFESKRLGLLNKSVHAEQIYCHLISPVSFSHH
jgi:hypothetical protein